MFSTAGDNCFINTDGLIFPTALVEEGTTFCPNCSFVNWGEGGLRKRHQLIWATVSDRPRTGFLFQKPDRMLETSKLVGLRQLEVTVKW